MAFKCLCRAGIHNFNMAVKGLTTVESTKITTAGIIVIGDEILKGEVQDTNSSFLAEELHLMGLKLKKISVIGDDLVEISEEVKLFSNSYDYVITSGGIGPTHDDITYEAVAMAFKEPLVLNPELRDICMKFYKTTDVHCPGMKLAYIPKSARLNFSSGIESVKLNYPNVSIKNVYMFPGIPQLLIKSFSCLKNVLFKSNGKFYSRTVYFNLPEDKMVKSLDELVKEFPDVQFGSYPKISNSDYTVKITIESGCEDLTKRAYEKLMMLVPKKHIVDVK